MKILAEISTKTKQFEIDTANDTDEQKVKKQKDAIEVV
jgi:hypothetical protein